MIIADLHIHSKHSRACSTNLDIDNLEKYARIKGVNVLGTGDFQHPKWQQELKDKLTDDGTGILRTKTGFPFVLSSEISLIYTQGGKGRKVHNVLLAPNMEVVEHITEALLKKGRIDYDGRPIFGMNCVEFTEMMMNISKDIEIIPAHIWTPWFALFGSHSGFDSIKECFGDQLKHIHAVETGLSSDPSMNWRLSQLDKFQLVSFSDAHSYWPWRLGREATRFNLAPERLSYQNILKGIRTGEKLQDTIEVSPFYGKYHYDGHRKCKVCFSPQETIQHKGICPKCKSKVTIGVDYRVEQLADRPKGFKRSNAKPFLTLIPVSDLIAQVVGKGVNTKTVWEIYNKLLEAFNSEYNILLNVPEQAIAKIGGEKLAKVLMLNREGKIKVQAGYDGEYGIPRLDEQNQENTEEYTSEKQKILGQF